MRKFKIMGGVLALTLALAGCGGHAITGVSSTSTTGTGTTGTGTTGTGTTGTTVTAASLTATTSATSIPSDGSASATITVLARNSANDLISGVVVAFASDSGGVAITNATTDDTGSAIAVLSTAGDPSTRTITVTATSGGLTATVKVQVVAVSSATTTSVKSLTMSTSAATILSDGSASATITALARDASNNVLAGVPITFAATSGAIQAAAATTDATGTVTATLTTGGDSSLRTITITGTTAALTSTVAVQVVAPSSPTVPVYSMGNGTGTGFVSGAIDLAVNDSTPAGTLAAGGTTGLMLTIVDQAGTLYTAAPVTVTFSSPCIASGASQIFAGGTSIPVTTIVTSTGSINGTYAAKGCSGSDLIKASATVASQSVSASATVTIAASTIGSIQFVSATPTTVGLKGTGLGETSTVIFKVTDSSGGAKSGVPVTFALNTTVGGLSLSPTSQTSASDGTVQTVVSSGTVHTVVRVTASIASPALSTQSSQLTVSTGLPASGAFSIAVGAPVGSSLPACPNVEGGSIDGITVPVTVRLADRYNNPVPDGTSIAFTTNGGHIGGSCTTPAVTSGDGTCLVDWVSAAPRPAINSDTPDLLAANRATVFATTIGEESFTDVNGSGFWQPGDPFVNLGEPFRDDNENGTYDSGEYFLDFNQNGHRDAGTGSFVGITCTGITAGSTCSTSTLAISASHLIIMSTSGANITLVGASGFTQSGNSLAIGVNGSGTATFNVVDLNNNSMAAGTTIAAAFSSSAGTLSATGITIGCNADVGGIDFVTSFAAGTTAGAGILTVTVTSPSGAQSLYNVSISVH